MVSRGSLVAALGCESASADDCVPDVDGIGEVQSGEVGTVFFLGVALNKSDDYVDRHNKQLLQRRIDKVIQC